MLREDIKETGEGLFLHFCSYRVRDGRIAYIKSNLVLPLRSHASLALWSAPKSFHDKS